MATPTKHRNALYTRLFQIPRKNTTGSNQCNFKFYNVKFQNQIGNDILLCLINVIRYRIQAHIMPFLGTIIKYLNFLGEYVISVVSALSSIHNNVDQAQLDFINDILNHYTNVSKRYTFSRIIGANEQIQFSTMPI